MRRVIPLAAVALLAAGTARAEDDQKAAKALVQKAIKATGGEKVLKQAKGVVEQMKGQVTVMGATIEFTGTSSYQVPDRLRLELNLTVMGNEVTQITVVNKDKGRVSTAGRTTALDKDAMKE